MSLLDVGCNGGFYAVEAKRRNAARVLAVDAARHHVQQAQFVRDALGLDLDVRRRSVYGLDPDDIGRFDITLALGLIYHCKHPMLALERLFDVTKTTLVVESAILPEHRFPDSFSSPLGGLQSTLHATAFVENPPGSAEAAYNWFLPGPAALEAMLRTVGFPNVNRVSVADGRVVLLATKPDAPATHLAARLTLLDGSDQQPLGETFAIRVKAENRGSVAWPATGERPVHLGAHLLADDGEETVVAWDWGRGVLPHDVAPGEEVLVEISLQAPARAGVYLVELDMVAEHLAWFEDLGSRPLRHPLRIG